MTFQMKATTPRTMGAARVLRLSLVWLVMLAIASPLLWALLSSLKPANQTLTFPVRVFPDSLTLRAYTRLLFETNFGIYLTNSMIVSLGTTAIVLVVGTLGAYALSRYRFPGADVGAGLILFSYFLPPSIIVVPIYLIINRIGLPDTLFGLILAYTSLSLPFAMWMMRLFFRALPEEIEQAARIDGASRFEVFREIVLPQALPGLISTSLFTFISAYNEYLFGFIFISTETRRTLPVGINSVIRSSYEIDWNMVMSASVAMTVPVLILVVCFQRYLLSGFGVGASKG